MNQESVQTSPPGLSGASLSSTQPASPMDELAFGLLINRALGGSDSRRPSDKSANDAQVDMVLGQAQNLAKMNDQYVETYVVRGTKELYALLGAIYSYALQINESPLRDHILQRMRERLEAEHEIKSQSNTPWITTVLRFILPLDRQTAYSYSKVLQVAHDENLTAQELPNYIKERGGIGKITGTKEEEESVKSIKEHKEAKTQMLRKILQANAKSPQSVVEVDDKFVLNTVADGKKEGAFEFAVCMNPGGNERRVVRFFKVNQSIESQLLNLISEASMPDDLEAMQGKLDMLREKLGITSGWGMKPGDKGYQPSGLPAINNAAKPEVMPNAPKHSTAGGVSTYQTA